MNILHWTKRERISTKQEQYSDVSLFKVPFSGVYNKTEMELVLNEKFGKPHLVIFRVKEKIDDKNVLIESRYSIGD